MDVYSLGQEVMHGLSSRMNIKHSNTSVYTLGTDFAIDQNWSVTYQFWGYSDIPFIVLRHKGKAMIKLDVCRITYSTKGYSLHLSKPSNKTTISIYNQLLQWIPKLDKNYLLAVRAQKESLENKIKINSGGYFLVEYVSLDETINSLAKLFESVIKLLK